MGYGPEDRSTVLELTYNYGVTEYDKGNGYAQVDSDIFFFCKSGDNIFIYILQILFLMKVQAIWVITATLVP